MPKIEIHNNRMLIHSKRNTLEDIPIHKIEAIYLFKESELWVEDDFRFFAIVLEDRLWILPWEIPYLPLFRNAEIQKLHCFYSGRIRRPLFSWISGYPLFAWMGFSVKLKCHKKRLPAHIIQLKGPLSFKNWLSTLDTDYRKALLGSETDYTTENKILYL